MADNDVMHNKNGKTTKIVDNDFSKIYISTLEQIRPDSARTYLNDFGGGEWNVVCDLPYDNCSDFIDTVYTAYLSDVNWLKPSDMTASISLRSDDTLLISVSAEKFIDSETIHRAYVESHDLKGEKGKIVKELLAEAAKEAGIEFPKAKQYEEPTR